jgi:myo-inositol catabolism protein IolS
MAATFANLGRTGPLLLRLGFGCEQLGGYQWGETDRGELEAAVADAVAAGVQLFDTADCYGLGESERRLGRLLQAARHEVCIATKFGVRFDQGGKVFYDASPAWATQALEGSLRRLGCDYVDLYQLHYWDGRTPLDVLFEHLLRLRDAGKCRYVGVTNLAPSLLPSTAVADLTSVSVEYSLVAREHESAALEAIGRGLAVLSYGTLGQGVLSGRYAVDHEFPPNDRRGKPSYGNFHGDRALRNDAIVAVVRAAADDLRATPAQIALAWVLARLPGSIPLVGIKRPQQLRDALGALKVIVPPLWLERLDRASGPAAAAHDETERACP